MGTHEHLSPEYNPHSLDAVAAKIFTRLDGQDEMLRRIEMRVAGQSDKMAKFERDGFKNRLMAMSGIAAAGHHLSTLFFK